MQNKPCYKTQLLLKKTRCTISGNMNEFYFQVLWGSASKQTKTKYWINTGTASVISFSTKAGGGGSAATTGRACVQKVFTAQQASLSLQRCAATKWNLTHLSSTRLGSGLPVAMSVYSSTPMQHLQLPCWQGSFFQETHTVSLATCMYIRQQQAGAQWWEQGGGAVCVCAALCVCVQMSKWVLYPFKILSNN